MSETLTLYLDETNPDFRREQGPYILGGVVALSSEKAARAAAELEQASARGHFPKGSFRWDRRTVEHFGRCLNDHTLIPVAALVNPTARVRAALDAACRIDFDLERYGEGVRRVKVPQWLALGLTFDLLGLVALVIPMIPHQIDRIEVIADRGNTFAAQEKLMKEEMATLTGPYCRSIANQSCGPRAPLGAIEYANARTVWAEVDLRFEKRGPLLHVADHVVGLVRRHHGGDAIAARFFQDAENRIAKRHDGLSMMRVTDDHSTKFARWLEENFIKPATA